MRGARFGYGALCNGFSHIGCARRVRVLYSSLARSTWAHAAYSHKAKKVAIRTTCKQLEFRGSVAEKWQWWEERHKVANRATRPYLFFCLIHTLDHMLSLSTAVNTNLLMLNFLKQVHPYEMSPIK